MAMDHENKEVVVEQPFRFNLPFQTKCGWPARLVGVLQRTAFPYVVAVWNPVFGAEEMVCYAHDGEQPVKDGIEPQHGALKGPLSLVNCSDDWYYRTKQVTHLNAWVEKRTAWPPNCNAMQHDHWSMGTPLVRGWIALHEGFGRSDFPDPLRWVELVNEVSGERFRVHFTPVEEELLK